MNRTFVSLFAVGLLAFGCAHQELTTKPAPSALFLSQAKAPPRAVPPPAPSADAAKPNEDEAIYFDFDSSLVRADARPVLQRVGAELAANPRPLVIEGNCDELGTVEYNLALGEVQALSAKDYLVHLGVPASRIAIASYGSQRPKYPGHDELARAENRRVDLIAH